MDLKLGGKRALVTGSSRGIGRSIALSLADLKVDVAINYLRNRTRAEETVREIEARGVRALLLKGNVAKPDHVERIFDAIEDSWGGLDIAVSAGTVDTDAPLHFPNREDLLESARQRTPAGRLVHPQDVANVVICLCTEYASMIHGQTLIVDGGYSILA